MKAASITKRFLAVLILLGWQQILIPYGHAAPISRSITISNSSATATTFHDWTTSDNSTNATVAADWGTITDVTNNAGQFTNDAQFQDPCSGSTDLDCVTGSGSVGRDLRKFAFTYDTTNLYMYVERYASATNVNDWWFYIDLDNDGLMESGEPILNVKWSGSNGGTTRDLYTYNPATPGGDPLICPDDPGGDPYGAYDQPSGWCPSVGTADGYDMPGTISTDTGLASFYGGAVAGSGDDINGNPLNGVSMETFVSWSDLGLGGPSSVGFHIASSNGTNLPSNLIDNSQGLGAGGGSIAFSELALTKNASAASVVRGEQFDYSIQIDNNGDSDTSNIEITDTLNANLRLNSIAGADWDCGTLPSAYGATLTCTYTGTLADAGSTTLTMTMDTVATGAEVTTLTNTATITNQDSAEINNPDDNSDSVNITLLSAPDLTIDKSHVGNFAENGTGTYNIVVTNTQSAGVYEGASTGTVTVTDTLPTGLTYNAASGGAGWSCGAVGQVVTCSSTDSVASGASMNNLAIVVNVGAAAVGNINNTATVATTTNEPDTTNNSDTDPTTVNAATSQQCYAVDGNNDSLSLVDTSDFTASSNEANIGATGVTGIDAVAYDCGTGTLYAANNGQIGTLNTGTGAFTALASPAGSSANGAFGNVNFNDIDGLSFDPSSGALYASVNRTGTDVLIQINTSTGAHVPNAFGAGIDYVAIGSIATVTDISVNHGNNTLYAIDGGSDNLLTVNKTTGATSVTGALGVSNIVGFGSDGSGGFWGSTSTGAITENVYEINNGTGAATNPRPIDGGGANDGSSFDYDAFVCQSSCAQQLVDLAVTKVVDDPTPLISTNVIFTITLTNNGPSTATAVQIIDSLPAGMTYQSDTPSQGSYDSTTGIWYVGSIASGATENLQLTASADTNGVKTNTASVAYVTQFDTDNTNDSASVNITPVNSDLSTSTKVGVDLNGGNAEPGDIIEYTISIIENAGAAVTGADLTDTIPANTENLSIQSIPAGADSSTSTATTVNVTGIDVAAGGIETVVFRVTISAGTPNNTAITNTATVNNPSGPGATPSAIPLVVSGSAETKTLYLSGGTSMTRVQHATNGTTVIAKNASNTWTLSPTIYSQMVLDSTQSIAIPVWITATQNNTNGATATLTCSNCDSPTIGSASVNIVSGGPTRYTFSINFGADVTVNPGSNYALTIANNSTSKSITVDVFNAGQYSQVDLNSADVIKVDSITFYDGAYPGGTAITDILPGDTIYVRAQASDPFGAFDITAASLQMFDSLGTEQVAAGTAMTELGALTTANTKTYEYQFDSLATDPTGTWSVLATADEGTEGTVSHTLTNTFIVRDSPSMTILKMVTTHSDPVNNTANPKAIPGAYMDYSVIVTNSGAGYADTDSSFIYDAIPAGTELFIGDFVSGALTATAGNGPVYVPPGSNTSTLTYTFTSLASNTDDVDFSDDNGANWDYYQGGEPVPPSGFDPNITNIRINPKGTHAGAGATNPAYTVNYRVRLQ